MSLRSRLAVASALIFLAPGCGTEPSSTIGLAEQSILGGSPDQDHPEVAALVFSDDHGALADVCSGVLVGPTLVLTAAHCLLDSNGAPWPVNRIAVLFGTDMGTPTVGGRVVRATMHPRYMSPGPGSTYDVGALELAEIWGPIPQPASLGAEPALSVGGAAVVVGYGPAAADAAPRFVRTASDQIITATSLLTIRHQGAGTVCDGDSGGPLFVNGALVGVAADGRPTCDGETTSSRLSASGDFVDAVARDQPVVLAPESCSACLERTWTGSGPCSTAYKACLVDSACAAATAIDESSLRPVDAGPSREALTGCSCNTGCADACATACGRAAGQEAGSGCAMAARAPVDHEPCWRSLLAVAIAIALAGWPHKRARPGRF